MNTLKRFAFLMAVAFVMSYVFENIGQAVAIPLGLNPMITGWVFVFIGCGWWGWYSDRIYNLLFVRVG